MTPTLKDAAQQEADQVDAEIAAAAAEREAEDQFDEQAEDQAEERPSDPAASHVTTWDRAPTQIEFNLAGEQLQRLKDEAHQMTPDQVVDALLQVVDVHESFRMPSEWPGESDEVLYPSQLLGAIGRFLLRGCRAKLEVPQPSVIFLWRNKKTWTSRGVEVRCKPKALSELERHAYNGAQAAVIANFRLFQHLTTRQKIAAIYGALRQLDKKGKIIPPQFEGFFDELALFGMGTFEQNANLARAVEQAGERDESLPWAVEPTFFDDDDDEDDDE